MPLPVGRLVGFGQRRSAGSAESETTPSSLECRLQRAGLDVGSLLASAQAFHAKLTRPFPTTANRIANFASLPHIDLVAQAQGTRILVPASLVPVLDGFLARKRVEGSPTERSLYAAMPWRQLVRRLIKLRPLAFLTGSDSTLTRDGVHINFGVTQWKAVGTERERPPLVLRDYLSYEEMALSALLAVSSPTTFINDGSRSNCGRPGAPGSFEPYGIFIGAVGARFEVQDEMEAKAMLGSAPSPVGAGTGSWSPQSTLPEEWQAFYTSSLSQPPQIVRCGNLVFNLCLYRQRIRTTLSLVIAEAECRAVVSGKPACLRLVGLGLGVWAIMKSAQTAAYIEEALAAAQHSKVSHIQVLELAWIAQDNKSASLQWPSSVTTSSGHSVHIRFTWNTPAAHLLGDDAGCLLVATYAWDSNAFPGNEFWLGPQCLGASGDPAAAACSTIAEIQNPWINHWMLDNVVVLE